MMNRVTIALIFILGISTAGIADIFDDSMVYQDTILIKFGQNSEIMILVEDEEDMKVLQNYDLNSMLSDLQISIDSMDGEETFLKIEDESGTKYLKDTSIVVEPEPEDDGKWLNKVEEWSDKWDDDDNDNCWNGKYSKDYSRKTRNYWNLEFGMNNYLDNGKFPDENNELYSVKPWGSWYVAVSTTNRTPVAGPLYLDWGAMVDWYNFKYQNFGTIMSKDENGVIFTDDPLDRHNTKSKLTSVYINGTFLPMFQFGKSGVKKDVFHWGHSSDDFRIGVGAYAGYRIGSHSKNVWRESGNKKKDHNNDSFYLNNFRYGVRFQFGFSDFDFFFNYDLNPLYIEGKGPNLNAFSFGVIL